MKHTTTLALLLADLSACDEAIAWVGDRSLHQAWEECERSDWMLWLCGKMAGNPGWPTREQIVLIACDIAESVLPIFEANRPGDNRPRKAIEISRNLASGKTSKSDLKGALYAATAANAAAYASADASTAYAATAAYAAADASTAYAATAAYAAADAAANAAAYAAAYADAAYADAAYAAYAAKKSKQLEICNLIRSRITLPEVL